jgi:3-hydroxyacyl-[acyl-carrier-protein] dehydratase
MSSPSRETLDQIKVLLRRDLKLGPDIEIPDDMPFAGTAADFDSLDILLLLTSIEKQFGIKIPSEVVGKEVFKNVSTLAGYVEREAASAGSKQPDYLAQLPHRDPFRFVTRVKSIKRGEEGEAAWSLKGDEPFFAGHFPNQPLVPGVLIAEALAQLSGLVGPSEARQGKLVHVDVRFDQSVAPPAELVLRSRLLRSVGELEQFEVSAAVGEGVVARGMLTLARPRDGAPGGAL